MKGSVAAANILIASSKSISLLINSKIFTHKN